MEFLVDRPARRSFAFLSFVMLCSSSCVALRCVAICCVLCSCLFPVVLRCVVLRFAVCIVLVFSLLCCVVLCCDLLLYSLEIFLLSFTLVPAQDGTTRPTDNGFTSTTSSTNATQRWSIDQLDGPLHFCLEFCHVVFFQLCCVMRCVAICFVLCSCLFPVVLRCVVLRFAVCIVLVFSLLCCVVLCCDLLLHSLDIFLLSFTFIPAQDGTTRPTDNGFTSTTSSTNATTLSTTSIVCSPHPNTLFFCLVFAMPTVL